jgi:hypothetical protein
VWRAGAGISRTEDAAAVAPRPEPPAAPPTAAPSAQPATAPPTQPVPGPPPEAARAATREVDDSAADEASADTPAEAKPKRRRSDPSERGLRDLVGAGPSQLGPVRAMRVRDANRPTAEDLAEAEQDVAIIRRHWTPPST